MRVHAARSFARRCSPTRSLTTLRRPAALHGLTARRSLATLLALASLGGAAHAQLVLKDWVGGQAGERMGHSVGYIATLTSVPNTRRLLIGEPFFDAGPGGALVDAGRVSYYHGAALNGPPLVTFLGAAAGDRFGWCVAGVGDINGDGHSDAGVGAPLEDVTPGGDEGRVRIYHGLTNALLLTLDGGQPGAQFGYALAGGGDLNGDGKADVLVGEPFFNAGAGRVSAYSGATGALISAFTGNAGSHLGWSLCGVGDANGDGRDDYAAGAPLDATAGAAAGRVVVLRGLNGALLRDLHGAAAGDEFGSAINSGHDANNDGVLDLLVGAPGAGGGNGSVKVLAGPTFLGTWWQANAASSGRLGSAVDFAGDVNKDGFDDVIAGAPQPAGGPGETGFVLCLDGKTGAALYTAQAGVADGDGFGSSVTNAGDADLDSWDDVLVGAPGADGGSSDGGGARLIGWQYVQPDVGGGGVGSSVLKVYGTPLATGGSATLALTGAPASTPAYFVGSVLQLPLPFKGGVLVPQLGPSIVLAFATTAAGTFTLTVPGGGGPFPLYAQFLVKDLAQPLGWQLTHCIRMDFLP